MPNGNGYPSSGAPAYEFSGSNPGGTTHAALRMLQEAPNPLNQAFFSDANVDAIETELARVIEQRTGYAIGPQDRTQLLAIMRYVYVQNSMPGDRTAAEVARLNRLVLREVVPMVGSAVAQHVAYLRDSSSLPVPIPRAANQSVKGQRSLTLRTGL